MTTERHPGELSRRSALAGVAVVGVGLPLLAACGGDDGGATAEDPAGTAGSADPSGSSGASGGQGGEGGPDGGLLRAADVEVGGGVVLAEADVVVTQPTEGEFKGWSAACTHQGCQVTEVVDGRIHCPCHGSTFSIEDGSPQGGPASVPLEEVPLSVRGGRIDLA